MNVENKADDDNRSIVGENKAEDDNLSIADEIEDENDNLSIADKDEKLDPDLDTNKIKQWDKFIETNTKPGYRSWNWARIRASFVINPLATIGTTTKIANTVVLGIFEILLAGISGEKDGGEFKDVMKFLTDQRTDPVVVKLATYALGYIFGSLTNTNEYVNKFLKSADGDKSPLNYFRAGVQCAMNDIKDISQYWDFRTTGGDDKPIPSSTIAPKFVATIVNQQNNTEEKPFDPSHANDQDNIKYNLDNKGREY